MWSALLPTICPVFPCANVGPQGATAALPALFSATLSPALLVYLCANVGPQVLLVVRLPAPFVPHSASLGPDTATRVFSALVPVSAPPTGLDFSVSSGCARRRSVSTYAAILFLHKSYSLI